mmetsp:Transcript_25988/g.56647  ORF Transcript_25988/g.56647 Transcript_25988/m.56647 type:complete len:122 (-) Transcript_25988:775-1140(-)|eukprot:CAMPEP_0202898270 /NCGR_PEP_ID=MMETSP1392-20130828/6825_1 /ASSEMBLY_ACC=CAM_ASM_000868 /TAXON_ID=225041 /ORGANISM="Chlamydomonas chlamydogama, Strain SAG 11-48b" /LENGTH=121 /DNA_ID=CAMNT_0049584141 /DNA_START=96 /DNA_END=461 /DNA_ORIENTATION=+
MSSITRLDCGKRLSEATIHNGTVYLAGQVPEVTAKEGKDMKAQAAEVLKCIDDLLTRAGTDKSRILMAQVYVTDLSEFADFNTEWDAWVAPGAAPARATVQVPKLADPAWKLEIVVTAALP